MLNYASLGIIKNIRRAFKTNPSHSKNEISSNSR